MPAAADSPESGTGLLPGLGGHETFFRASGLPGRSWAELGLSRVAPVTGFAESVWACAGLCWGRSRLSRVGDVLSVWRLRFLKDDDVRNPVVYNESQSSRQKYVLDGAHGGGRPSFMSHGSVTTPSARITPEKQALIWRGAVARLR